MSRRPYNRPMSSTWFMSHPAYKFYMVREASCVFDGLYALNLFYGLVQLATGQAAWEGWLSMQANPLMIAFAAFTFGITLLHSFTFIGMTPRVMPQHVRKMIPDNTVRTGMFAGLALVSAVIVGAAVAGGFA